MGRSTSGVIRSKAHTYTQKVSKNHLGELDLFITAASQPLSQSPISFFRSFFFPSYHMDTRKSNNFNSAKQPQM